MSYDLTVYTRASVSNAELRELVEQGSGLQAEFEADDRLLTVLRGARRRYSFDVGGIAKVEPEDIPDEVAAVLLGARYVYSIGVQGTVQSEIPHAVRFARRLALAADGAVLDQQTDVVWSRSQSRKVLKPSPDERVAVVDVAWYCLREHLPSDAATTFFDVVQRALPEALPRRFGELEPLQGKLDADGRDGFINAWENSTIALSTLGSSPCIAGRLDAGACAENPGAFWWMSLTFLADPIREPAWREALQTMFVTLADALPVFYASAELNSGHIWSGRSWDADRETEWPINPVVYGQGWTGLPPVPTWWLWLGPPYAEYHSALPAERTTSTSRGVFYSAADELSGPSGLLPLSTWLPEDLFSSLLPSPPGWSPVPLAPAETIPPDLQRTPS